MEPQSLFNVFYVVLSTLLAELLVMVIAYWVVRSYTKKAFKVGFWLIDDYVMGYL